MLSILVFAFDFWMLHTLLAMLFLLIVSVVTHLFILRTGATLPHHIPLLFGCGCGQVMASQNVQLSLNRPGHPFTSQSVTSWSRYQQGEIQIVTRSTRPLTHMSCQTCLTAKNIQLKYLMSRYYLSVNTIHRPVYLCTINSSPSSTN